MAGVVGASSLLDAKYLAVRQDKGSVGEAAAPWAGARPKGDVYAGNAVDLFSTVGAPLEGGTGLVLCRCKLWFDQRSVRHEGGSESRAASSPSSGSAPPSHPGSKTPNLCAAIGTPWTCAPERPVRHGLVSGYIVASSGSAMSSSLGSKARDLFRAPWTCAPVTCSPRTGASESIHRDWNIMDLFIETCSP